MLSMPADIICGTNEHKVECYVYMMTNISIKVVLPACMCYFPEQEA